MFQLDEVSRLVAKIKVIGIGGGGGNAVNSMVSADIFGVEFVAVNTDRQHLEASLAPVKVQIGESLTKGLGAGSNPAIGRQAAIDDKEYLMSIVEGADMIFITAGMGGGTGTGAAPVIAKLAQDQGILTVAVVTRPFYYEGRRRAINGEEGIRELHNCVDSLIVIPNDRIHLVVEKGTPLVKSFSIANDVLRQAIQGISDLILVPGLINLDFADVKAIMQKAGRAVIGVGRGEGECGAFEAAKKAISNRLLEESSIEGAKGILINITGGSEMSLDSVQEAASLIRDSSHDEANIILGAVINPDMNDSVQVTVIATGLEERIEKAELPKIRKWAPAPAKESVCLKGSERILSKNIGVISQEDIREEECPAKGTEECCGKEQAAPLDVPSSIQSGPAEAQGQTGNSIFSEEDVLDIPTFLRKKM
jgi:cell division protein FtsZ